MSGNAAAALFFTLLLIGTTMVFIWALQLRYKRRELLHRERLAALEKGMDLPPLSDVSEKPRAPWSPRIYLLRGLMWLFSGTAIAVSILGVALSTSGVESLDEKFAHVQRAKFIGMSEDQIKALMEQPPQPRRGIPASVALFGLIPIGVGAAYLVVYSAEKKRASEPAVENS